MEPDLLILLSSIFSGLAWAALASLVLGFLTIPVRRQGALDSFEQNRRQRMRDGSTLYRWFEAGFDKLGRWNARRKPERLDAIRKNLMIAGEPLPMTPEEYLTYRQLESFIAGVVVFALVWLLTASALTGVIFGVVIGFGYSLLTANQIAVRAQKRMQAIKKRLPFCVDLMALMMEAGANFHESMTTAIRENEGHPLADEFRLVQRDISLGRTRQDALLAMQHRLGDEDVAEIIFAVNKGEELGTPLSQILRTQAEQMRLKRSQWIEKASAEAQVSIVFPGMIIMIACLLIVTAPFVLGAFYSAQ